MYYRIPVQPLPEVCGCSTYSRKTIWSCTHHRNTLIFIHEGSCRFNINEKNITVSEGHILFIPAEQNYTRYPINNAECKMTYIYFKTASPVEVIEKSDIQSCFARFEDEIAENILSPSVEFQEMEKEVFISDHIDTAEHTDTIDQTLETTQTQLNGRQRYSQLYCSARLLEILSVMGQISLSEYRSNTLSTHIKYPLPLEKAIIYITKNYRQKITMTELSKYCNVSPQHLIRLFRTHMNITPVQYINQNKIAHAVEMLMITDLSISEISYALGFSDPGYFSRLFKKMQKRSPNEARIYINNYDKKQKSGEKQP